MRIGFDGKRAVQNFTGLGNYSRYVIDILYRFAPENEYVLYAPRRRLSRVFDELLYRCPLLKTIYPEGMWRHFKSLWRAWGMTSRLDKEGIDLFHGLSNELPLTIRKARHTRSVVTIHDLIFLRYPEYYQWIDPKIYAYKFRKACEYADLVIAISECTKRDIISYFHIPEEKIKVVYQGCDVSFTIPATDEKKQEVREKYSLPEHYILNVGSIEERKNVLLAVKSLLRLPEEMHLVILGRRTAYTDRIDEFIHAHHLEERVKILNGVPFADLPAIYQQAKVFVYPSRFEGFGIPIIEAIYSGIPVVAATGSCLEEAGGPASIYVHPNDVEGMAEALKQVSGNQIVRARMIKEGKNYVRRFSEEEQARQLMRIYSELCQ